MPPRPSWSWRTVVSVPGSDAKGLRVPPDNPFLDGVPIAAVPEIWGFGLVKILPPVTPGDADADGLPDDWELQFGLDPLSAAGNDGATARICR